MRLKVSREGNLFRQISLNKDAITVKGLLNKGIWAWGSKMVKE